MKRETVSRLSSEKKQSLISPLAILIFLPPSGFVDRLREITNGPQDTIHRYMPNAGWPDVREKIAQDLQQRVH